MMAYESSTRFLSRSFLALNAAKGFETMVGIEAYNWDGDLVGVDDKECVWFAW